MNIFEISGVNNEGLIISEMIEKRSLKEAIEYGNKWAKQQNVMLQSVKMAYLDTQKRNKQNYNNIERNLTHKKKQRVVSKYKPSRRR